jgi:FkbM family methyltransferase
MMHTEQFIKRILLDWILPFARFVKEWLLKVRKEPSSRRGIISKRYIKRFLPLNPVIVEAGAHIGLDTIEMSKIWINGIVYSFEPIPQLFDKLMENTINLRNVRCFNLALSEKSGITEMFVSSGQSDASSSLLIPKEHLSVHPGVVFNSVIEVPTMTLDLWAEENMVNKVDFLWLDMQGCELSMLKASPRILRNVRVIRTEVFLKELYEGAPLYVEVREWLENHGFRVELEKLAWNDAGYILFVR